MDSWSHNNCLLICTYELVNCFNNSKCTKATVGHITTPASLLVWDFLDLDDISGVGVWCIQAETRYTIYTSTHLCTHFCISSVVSWPKHADTTGCPIWESVWQPSIWIPTPAQKNRDHYIANRNSFSQPARAEHISIPSRNIVFQPIRRELFKTSPAIFFS